jgi:DNA-binding transcriptional LysR family regulator
MEEFEGTVAFLTVVQEGSFAAAARRLGLPPSSVTRRVQRLEGALCVTLLQRTTRSVRLTPAGEAYRQRAAPALEALEEAQRSVSEAGTAPRGRVRMTVPADFSESVLAPVIARFHQKYPEVHVELEVSQRRVDLVDEGFDLALRGGPLEDSSLIVRKLISMASVAFASPDFLQRYGTPQRPADLASVPCVLFRARSGRARWSLTRRGRTEHVEVRGPVSVDLMGLNRAFMLEGVGVGIMPKLYCQPDVQASRAVPILPGWEQAGHGLSLVFPPVQPLPRRVQVLRDFLIEELDEDAIRESQEGR